MTLSELHLCSIGFAVKNKSDFCIMERWSGESTCQAPSTILLIIGCNPFFLVIDYFLIVLSILFLTDSWNS